MKILVAFDTVREGFEELCEKHEVLRPPQGRDFSREELLSLIPEYDVLCAVFDVPVDRELMDAGKQLKLVANYSVGLNNIDLEYAREKGIAVCNTPVGVVTSTAELAMALMLACSRRVVELHSTMVKEGDALEHNRLARMGVDLCGKRLGVLGYGNIGRAVAKRCQAFGMQVLYNKRRRLSPELERDEGIVFATKEEILRSCDVVSVHTPLTPETHHYIGKRELEMMKPTAILINTSRGPVVNEKELVDALRARRIQAAGLDVFEYNDTPLPELYALDNAVITPHVGSQTYESRVYMAREMCDSILGFLDKDRPVSRVV